MDSSSTIWSLVFKLQGDAADLRRELDSVQGRLNNFERTASNSTRNVSAGFSQMQRGAGQLAGGIDRLATRAVVAAAGGLTAVVKMAIDTETAFAGVQKTVDETATMTYPKLSKAIDDLNRKKPQSWAEMAQIGEFGGQLGVLADDIPGFIDIISDFLVAVPQMGLEAAAFGLRRIEVLTKADGQLKNIASTVVELGNNYATTEDRIIDTTERFASQATAIGLSTQASLGLATALTALGGEPQEAGTSMQRLFQRINLALAEGGEQAELFARVSGMSAEKFRTSWERDAEGTLIAFLRGMGDVNLSAIEQTSILDELGLADARLGKNVLNLANNMDVTEAALKTANDEWERATALGIEAEKRYATAASKIAVLRNNLQLAAVAVGEKLLPTLVEAAEEFTAWVQLPSTQRGIEQFAENLAKWIRQLVSDIRSTDWSPLLETVKGAAGFAKAAFEAFNALPGPVKQILLGAIVANKISGGALGMMAKGAGNILAGALKVGLAMRGSSPANPMWVAMVGGGIGGAAGGAAAAGRGALGGLLGNLTRAIGVVAVAGIASEVAPHIGRIGEDLHDQWGIPDPPKWLTDFLSTPLPDPFDLFGGPAPKQIGPTIPKTAGRSGGAADFDRSLLAQFGGKLDKLATNDVIEHLARTNEMGLKGVGTSFQIGLANGLDPLGDTATRILARAEDPKAPAVMAEIKGHLLGLEEIQATYLERGDIRLAAKVQDNIDTLHDLIGTTDAHRAVTARMAANAASSDVAMINSVNAAKARIDAMHGTLSSKNFSPIVSVAVNAAIYGGASGASVSTSFAGAKLHTKPIALHEGTWDVPATGLAMLHEGEMVVPAFDAAALRQLAADGGTNAGGDTNINVEVQGLLRAEEPRDLVRPLRALARTGHMQRRPRYTTGTRR